MEQNVRNNRLLESKISIPRILCLHIKRETLCRRLEAFGQKPEQVAVLNGGAGFGKTMLLSYFAVETEKNRCAWYSLDAMDNNLESFADYLACSIQRAVPEFQAETDGQPGEGRQGAVSLAYDFAAGLNQISPRRLFLILDDFQEITSEDVLTFLSVLVENTGDHIKFMIATKAAFPDFLLRYYYSGSVELISSRELSFSREEIGRLLSQSRNVENVDSCAGILEEYSEGWPVGVMSVLLQVNQRRNPVSPEELGRLCDECPANDYLIYEVYRKLPYEMQKFLTETSALEVLSADLCDAALDIRSGKSMLDYLVRENLFVNKLGGEGEIYRYHSLFKACLERQLSFERKKQICRKACLWSLAKGMNGQAMEYAMKCDDFELFQLALERYGVQNALRYEKTELSQWRACLEQHRDEWNPSAALLAEEISRLEKESAQDIFALPAEKTGEDGEEKKEQDRLEVDCFGGFAVRVKGKEQEIRWRTKKAGELFAFLFHRRGKEVSKDVLTEALWPDMLADSVSALFYTTASYVRKALANEGFHDIIRQKQRMYSLDMSRLDSPREKLEELDQETEGLENRTLATALYRGPYLEGVQGDWYMLEREYYERIFLHICRVQAAALTGAKRYQEAAGLLSAAVASDEYDEQLSAMLIRCYGQLGDMKNVRRQYERTVKLLEEEMGMEPGEELKAAYREAAGREKNKT